MPSQRHRQQTPEPRAGDEPARIVTDESLVLRNYDSERTHAVTVRLFDADADVAATQRSVLSPLATVSVAVGLPRSVYRVEARVDDELTDSAECLVGSGPRETALIEVGNGLVNVADGVF